ncbi:hypothetical protein [Pseudarthrobacter sp. SSS035]|uniref:hypothetical protein n=1 Tax=Pseudarthrobacter sp. SSS035 TaxID=2931399 RepID=UPI00200C9D73|nr:hypothetical protein [Pseudarthrobacter sp. SSS035]
MKKQSSMHRRWSAGIVLWALLILAFIVLMVVGLQMSFLFVSTPQLEQRAATGRLFIYAGSLLSLGAAFWSHAQRNPRWVTLSVGAPAVFVGGAALILPDGLVSHMAAIIALPAAFAGLLGGVLAKPRP